MRSVRCVDQLRGDAHAPASFANRAFEDIADPKVAPNPLYVDNLALVRKTRIPGDDEEPADAAECGNDLFDHTVGEILLFRVAAQIGERQHRDRWLVGEGK